MSDITIAQHDINQNKLLWNSHISYIQKIIKTQRKHFEKTHKYHFRAPTALNSRTQIFPKNQELPIFFHSVFCNFMTNPSQHKHTNNF